MLRNNKSHVKPDPRPIKKVKLDRDMPVSGPTSLTPEPNRDSSTHAKTNAKPSSNPNANANANANAKANQSTEASTDPNTDTTSNLELKELMDSTHDSLQRLQMQITFLQQAAQKKADISQKHTPTPTPTPTEKSVQAEEASAEKDVRVSAVLNLKAQEDTPSADKLTKHGIVDIKLPPPTHKLRQGFNPLQLKTAKNNYISLVSNGIAQAILMSRTIKKNVKNCIEQFIEEIKKNNTEEYPNLLKVDNKRLFRLLQKYVSECMYGKSGTKKVRLINNSADVNAMIHIHEGDKELTRFRKHVLLVFIRYFFDSELYPEWLESGQALASTKSFLSLNRNEIKKKFIYPEYRASFTYVPRNGELMDEFDE